MLLIVFLRFSLLVRLRLPPCSVPNHGAGGLKRLWWGCSRHGNCQALPVRVAYRRGEQAFQLHRLCDLNCNIRPLPRVVCKQMSVAVLQ